MEQRVSREVVDMRPPCAPEGARSEREGAPHDARGRARAARVGGRDRDRAGDQEERELLESAHGALETLAPGPPAGVLNSGRVGLTSGHDQSVCRVQYH